MQSSENLSQQFCIKTFVRNNVCLLIKYLNCGFQWLGLLPIRLILAWEFWESGVEKYHGMNWFADIKDQFPFPFNYVPTDISWSMATWVEIIGSICLLFGLATRFSAVSLFILTVVAIFSAHWPSEWHSLSELWQGYALTDEGHGNYKLPLIFMVMLFPLILKGPGKLSIDALIARFCCNKNCSAKY